MVERAERIIKAGLDAGFTYRFLAKDSSSTGLLRRTIKELNIQN